MKSSQVRPSPHPDGSALGREGIPAWLLRHEIPALGLVLVLAALVRLLRWKATAAMFNDGPIFLALGEAIARGDWSTALGHPFHPLYPATIAAARGLIGDWEAAAVAVSVVCGTLAVACLHRFVRAAFDPTRAWIAALLLAVHPIAIEYSGDIQSEGLYLLLFIGSAATLWNALRKRSARRAFVGGGLVGAAYLTRPEGIGLAIVASALVGWRFARGSWDRRTAAVWIAALALGTAAVAGPYLTWLRSDLGIWSVTQKKSLGVVAGIEEEPLQGPDPLAPTPVAPQPRRSSGPRDAANALPPAAEPSLSTRFGEALADLAKTHLRVLRYELLFLLLLGWALTRGRPSGARDHFVAAVIGFYAMLLFLLAINVGYVSGRHVLPGVTLAFGHVAHALLACAGAGAALRSGRAVGSRRRTLAVALILVLVAALGLGKSLRPQRQDSLAERRAAEWLRRQDLPVHAVAARKRRTAYYAGAPYVKLASAAFPGGLRALGATHLILSDEDRDDYPKLEPLEPPEARLLHRTTAAGHTASVFALVAHE